ncbi:MAG: dimethylmenaquinone methyltransferase [Planctomycetaceae bacterium]|nr:dimethylmenaquinone methyltransferase [Planctomycetaceae bacterium]
MNEPAEITLEMARESLYSAVVSDALDGLGYTHQSPRVQLPPLTGCSKLVGRCKTTLWAEMAHEDPNTYELELEAVDTCGPDGVMIAAAGGSMRSGIWGELLTNATRNSGGVGAIVDGAIRDVAKITEMGFPVFGRGMSVYDSMNRCRVVNIDVVVEIDGVRFCPGDFVIADVDGVVVVPRAVEGEALRAAWQKVHAENEVREAIKKGMGAREAWDTFGVL